MAAIRFEAEDLNLSGYTVESNADSGASGGMQISLIGTDATEGIASGVFTGAAGFYNVVVGYYDENDGVSPVTITVGSKSTSFEFDQGFQSNRPSQDAATNRVTHERIWIEPGESFQLQGSQNQGEYARFDYIEFVPVSVADPFFVRMEAESMERSAYRVESTPLASGDELVSLKGGSDGETGRLSSTFQGASGTYNVVLNYFDENDGIAQVETRIGDRTIAITPFDQDFGTNWISADNRVQRVVAENVTIQPGDPIELIGLENGGEYARIDSIEFVPTEAPAPPAPPAPQPPAPDQPAPSGDPIRMEAEDMERSVYRVESPAIASGGEIVSLAGYGDAETGRLTSTFEGESGTYKVVLSYFDENDGVAQVETRIGDRTLATTSFDQESDNNYIGEDNRVRQVVASEVTIQQGDRIELIGQENSGEHARIDYIEFIPVEVEPAPSPSPTPQPPAEEFQVYNGKLYRLTTTAATWEEAQAEAESLGGNLVTINDANEEAWLRTTFGTTEGFWIGLSDRAVEGQFEWANGEDVTYTNWAPGEPNNDGNQDFAWMNYGEQWDDHYSSAQMRGIIELQDPNATPPDTQAPTVTASLSSVSVANGSAYDLTVTFSDESGIAVASLDGNDIDVSNGSGFSQQAALLSLDAAQDGASITATYRIVPPGGTWDSGDNGTYTVTLQPGQVSDTSGNSHATPQSLGTFEVNVPTPPQPSVPSGDPIRLEAEDMERSVYRVESPAIASGGEIVSLAGYGDAETGRLTSTFEGESGTYKVVLSYFDENDGVAQVETRIGDRTLATTSFDLESNNNYIGEDNRVRQVVASEVTIQQGDRIELIGQENGGEYARIDYLEFIPVATSGAPTPPPDEPTPPPDEPTLPPDEPTLPPDEPTLPPDEGGTPGSDPLPGDPDGGGSAIAPDTNIGTNLASVRDWSTQYPFTDFFKNARPWVPNGNGMWDTGEGDRLDQDEQGWIRSLPSGNSDLLVEQVTTLVPIAPAFNRYVIFYEGEGAMRYSGNATLDESASRPGRDVITTSGDDAMLLSISETDPNGTGNYIRNIRVVPEPFLDIYETQPFNPDFLESLQGMESLRFMDWMETNNSDQRVWSDRTEPGDFNYRNVPVEVMVDLANQAGIDPWFNMPHQATDDYVRNFAEYVRDNLDPNLRVYVEYSNEVWNGMFEQSQYATQQGQALFSDMGGSDFDQNRRFFALRTAQVTRIWDEVFGADKERVIGVVGAQSENPWTASSVLGFIRDQGWTYEEAGIDSIAIAPYFGGYLGSSRHEDTLTRWTREADGGLNSLFTELSQGGMVNDGPVGGALAQAYEKMQQYVDLANREGLTLTAYEGGQHLVGVGNVVNNEAITNLFIAANRDPRMGQLYREYFAQWDALGGDLFANFSDVGEFSKWGSWGMRENLYEADAAKFDAIESILQDRMAELGQTDAALGTTMMTMAEAIAPIDGGTSDTPLEVASTDFTLEPTTSEVVVTEVAAPPPPLSSGTPDPLSRPTGLTTDALLDSSSSPDSTAEPFQSFLAGGSSAPEDQSQPLEALDLGIDSDPLTASSIGDAPSANPLIPDPGPIEAALESSIR